MAKGEVIERKAYIGRRDISSFNVPETVSEICDWAFAGCAALTEVSMPRCSLGRGVFKDCDSLKFIRIYGCDDEDMAALLAEAARQDMTYLLDLAMAGSAEWYAAWDAWLLRFLSEPDEDGYSGQLPSGEEDYSAWDAAGYVQARRREKARRCLLRLVYSESLSGEAQLKLCDYVAAHSLNSPEGDAAWQLILTRHAEDESWYKAFAEAGGINTENSSEILSNIPDSNVRMKSFFIRHLGDGSGNIFSELMP